MTMRATVTKTKHSLALRISIGVMLMAAVMTLGLALLGIVYPLLRR